MQDLWSPESIYSVAGLFRLQALRINNEAKKKASCGEIVSLMSVDAERLQEFIIRMFFGVTVPVVLTVDIFVVYFYMAEAAFAASLVLVFLTPVTRTYSVITLCQVYSFSFYYFPL